MTKLSPCGWAVLALVLCLPLAGCGGGGKARSGQALYELKLRDNPEGAWRMAKKEADAHAVPNDEESCKAHSVALHVLAENAGIDSAPPDADAQADALIGFAERHCQGSPYLMTAEGHMARYLHYTGRPGQALPHAERCLSLAEKAGATDQAGAHQLMAVLFDEMGFKQPRDLHINEAQQVLARHLGQVDRSRDAAQVAAELKLFQSILMARLDYLSREPADPARDKLMASLMAEAEAMDKVITDHGDRPALYARGVALFARAGNPGKAAELQAKMAEVAVSDRWRDDLDLAEAEVLAAQGRSTQAADLFAATLARMRAQGVSPDFNQAHAAARASLAAGRPAEADAALTRLVAEMEARRGSFAVERRERYLSDMKIRVYWDLLRARTLQYLEHPEQERFDAALDAAMMLRARQFGDILGIRSGAADGSRVSAALGKGEILLSYVATADGLVAFSFSPGKRDLALIDLPGPRLAAMVERARDLVADLGAESSAASELGRTVLGPLAADVLAAKRLTVIPDGPLNAVPFAMLRPEKGQPPLVEGRSVAYAPSIAFLLKAKPPSSGAGSSFLVLADPDYDGVRPPDTFATRAIKVAAKDDSLFIPLPETRQEAEAIRTLAGSDKVTALYGHDAAKSRLLGMPLNGYTNLHFATHGILGGMVPGVYEPALVLTATGGEDGFLRLSEIQGMRLDSRLVVLSACDTGRGEYFAGEGVMGLSRGFLLAGSRAVLVSLWPVVSDSTVRLMRVFYEHLLAGGTPEASLRAAQLDIMSDPATAAPLYWAPFVLIGR